MAKGQRLNTQKREQDSSRSRMDKNFGLYKYHSFTTFTFRTVPSVRVTRRMYRPEGMSEVLTVVCGDGRDARPCVSTDMFRPNMSNISTRAIFALPSVTATCRMSFVGFGWTVNISCTFSNINPPSRYNRVYKKPLRHSGHHPALEYTHKEIHLHNRELV